MAHSPILGTLNSLSKTAHFILPLTLTVIRLSMTLHQKPWPSIRISILSTGQSEHSFNYSIAVSVSSHHATYRPRCAFSSMTRTNFVLTKLSPVIKRGSCQHQLFPSTVSLDESVSTSAVSFLILSKNTHWHLLKAWQLSTTNYFCQSAQAVMATVMAGR